MNKFEKMGTKNLLELAGVDITTGKAKLLIESEVAKLEAELKELNRELMSAKAGGNDDMVAQFKEDIIEVKEKIKDAVA